MYTPRHYRNTDLQEVKSFISQNSFGILVNFFEDRPWGTHIPLELQQDTDGRDVLVGHVAKANPQWKHFDPAAQVLCIFNGPHSYVSSSWYHDEEVPTWNYIAVHVYGRIQLLGEDEVLASLHDLVNKYEKNSQKPINLNELSPDTMAQIRGIVGFKIVIDDIQATYKLSQGREKDHPSIISALEKRDAGAKAIAAAIQHQCPLK